MDRLLKFARKVTTTALHRRFLAERAALQRWVMGTMVRDLKDRRTRVLFEKYERLVAADEAAPSVSVTVDGGQAVAISTGAEHFLEAWRRGEHGIA